jgi:hypothetical protein
MTRPEVTAGPIDRARRPANASLDPACPSNRAAGSAAQSSPIEIARFVAITLHQFANPQFTNCRIHQFALGFY